MDRRSIWQAKMTRAFVVIWLIVVAAMPVSAHAMGSARDLADDCRTLVRAKTGAGKQIRIPFTKKALVCWGYMQAMQDLSVLADEDGRRIMGACPPERTTLLKLIQAFVSYAHSHTDELPNNAALAVTRALQEAFPCGVNGTGFRHRRRAGGACRATAQRFPKVPLRPKRGFPNSREKIADSFGGNDRVVFADVMRSICSSFQLTRGAATRQGPKHGSGWGSFARCVRSGRS